MDPDISKAALEVTERVAESIAPSLVSRIFSLRFSAKGTKDVPRQAEETPVAPVGAILRAPKVRGEWERRQKPKDRRVSSLSQRMRKGFWLEFHRRTEMGKFDFFKFDRKMRDDLSIALVAHADHYLYADRALGVAIEPALAVETAVKIVWANESKRPEVHAVNVVEAIAECILKKFNVSKVDRREVKRRVSST